MDTDKMTSSSRDYLAVMVLARLLYMSYCDHNKYAAKPAPYAPGWAHEYAQIAVSAFGYDDSDLDNVLAHAGLGGAA